MSLKMSHVGIYASVIFSIDFQVTLNFPLDCFDKIFQGGREEILNLDCETL